MQECTLYSKQRRSAKNEKADNQNGQKAEKKW